MWRLLIGSFLDETQIKKLLDLDDTSFLRITFGESFNIREHYGCFVDTILNQKDLIDLLSDLERVSNFNPSIHPFINIINNVCIDISLS